MLSVLCDIEEKLSAEVVVDVVDDELTGAISEPNQIVYISCWSAVTNVHEMP